MSNVISLGKDWFRENRESVKEAVIQKKRKPEKRYLTVAQVAEQLACSVDLVYDAIHAEKEEERLDAIVIGKRRYRIGENALDEYKVRRQKVG